MISAKQILKEPINKIILKDGNQYDEEGYFFGGVSYLNETLENFLGEIEKDFNKITLEELLDCMIECNILFK